MWKQHSKHEPVRVCTPDTQRLASMLDFWLPNRAWTPSLSMQNRPGSINKTYLTSSDTDTTVCSMQSASIIHRWLPFGTDLAAVLGWSVGGSDFPVQVVRVALVVAARGD